MYKILYIIEKEFKQIFRNKTMAGMIIGMPILQLLVLSYAVDFEVKSIDVFIEDKDNSHVSKELINKIDASEYFNVFDNGIYKEGLNLIEHNTVDAILTIPQEFGENLTSGKIVKTAIIIDAIDGSKAGIINNYLQQSLVNFTLENAALKIPIKNISGIEIKNRNWYNPTLDYKIFMVPGILVLLVTMISLFLSSMNIVREKEIGTIEQLNVTPITKIEFIIGKQIPFIILGIVEFTIGLLIALFWFKIPVEGSYLTLYVFTAAYLTLILGMGMFISTFTDTQQQAMFLAWFFSVIFILMSGLFTPIESMPIWAQKIADLNPIKYYVEVIRLTMLKGSTFANVASQFLSIIIYSIILNTFAVLNYKKTNS